MDLAVHGVVGTLAVRSVLDRSEVAQRRMAVLLIVLVCEVADHYPGFEQGGPAVAFEALLS